MSPSHRPDESASLAEFLAPGVETDDVPELAPLLRAGPLIGAFITLFRGSEAEVLARLLVLREMGRQSHEAPRWTPEALRARFSFLDSVKLETVLKRLRENGLLAFAADGLYHLSDLGRNAVAAIGMLVQFSAEEDLELGFLTAQLAGLQAVGEVSAEALGHLLAKLNDLSWHFEEAIASGSEFRIRASRRRLSANMRWLEKGTNVLKSLLADPEVPFELATVAQRIGLAQSRLSRADAAFQRALNKIENQRVTLGGFGISSSDVATWLRTLDPKSLADMAEGVISPAPQPPFLAGGHELLDRAELVLSEEVQRLEADQALPATEATPVASQAEKEDLHLLEHFTGWLDKLTAPTELGDVVAGGGFPASSYRLSLLALLADGESGGPVDGPVAEFLRLPLDVEFGDELVAVNQDEIAVISAGRVSPRK